MNETKIKELTEQISKATVILNDLTAQLEAEKNKATEKKEPSIEDRWKPEEGDVYIIINGGGALTNRWGRGYADREYYEGYNIWKNFSRAKEVHDKTKFLWLMEQIHDILCPDYKPDWRNKNVEKFILFFNTMTDKWDRCCCYNSVYTIAFFDTIEHAKQACKILNDMGVKPC